MVNPALLAHAFDAPPGETFFGRHDALDALTRAARDALRGEPRLVAILGPRGAGKSALLRRAIVVLHERGADVVPVMVDLTEALPSGSAEPGRTPDEVRWSRLMRAVLRRMLVWLDRVPADHPAWLAEEPGLSMGLCYAAGLGALAPLCRPGVRFSLEAWRALLAVLAAHGPARPLAVIDGAADAGPEGEATLATLLEGCHREGCAAVFEGPGGDAGGSGFDVDAVERLTLEPLAMSEAAAVAQAVGRRRQWALPEAALRPVLARLGPWPGWVRGWAMAVEPPPPKTDPRRVAEEAYGRWLTESAWAGERARELEAAIGVAGMERALRLIDAAAARPEPLDAMEAAALTGASEAEAARWCAALARIGLLERCGARWGGPRTPAVADWVRLRLAATLGPHGAQAARLDLVCRYLMQAEAAEAPAVAPAVPAPARLLERFRGQMVPRVLFEFGDYHEALGRLMPPQRRQMVFASTATVQLPETVGTAPWPGGGLTADGTPRITYGRAFRGGQYRRSHEELWIVFDWSDVRALTTPEIRQGMEAARTLEARHGGGRCIRWLIVGEAASPEALELIRRERWLCSNREQLLLLDEALAPAPADAAPASPNAPAGDRPPRRSVIDLAEAIDGPRPEVSRLSLPARPDSEVIAASMAEKIAIRAGFDPSAVGQIKTAVLEGVLNAIEHSPNSEKLIEVAFDLTPAALAIVIENEGRPFEPPPAGDPTGPATRAASLRKRGWGIALMHRFMDEVAYQPCRHGTRLRLVKRRPQRPADQHAHAGEGP